MATAVDEVLLARIWVASTYVAIARRWLAIASCDDRLFRKVIGERTARERNGADCNGRLQRPVAETGCGTGQAN